jgi:hypothetical protein
VAQLLSRLTLAEKVGQLAQVQAARTPDLDARLRAGRVSSIFGIVDPRTKNCSDIRDVKGSNVS